MSITIILLIAIVIIAFVIMLSISVEDVQTQMMWPGLGPMMARLRDQVHSHLDFTGSVPLKAISLVPFNPK